VRKRRHLSGGSNGNGQLTALVAVALLLALAVEGATILRINELLTVHAFVGMLLIPIVALKIASTGWRAFMYYRGADEYVRRGPPHLVLRAFVAPVVLVSTIAVFTTGVALLALDRAYGTLVALHKASFLVWLPATALHVLAHVAGVPARLFRRLPGIGVRVAALSAAVAVGAAVAVVTLPAADHLQDAVSAPLAIDAS
jgi:hypothetical protein